MARLSSFYVNHKDALTYRFNQKKHLLGATNLCIIKIPTDASVQIGGIHMCAARRLSESERKNEIMNSAVDVITQKVWKMQRWKRLLLVLVYQKVVSTTIIKNVNENF